MADWAAIFKAYDVRGVYPDQLDEDAARRIGRAFAAWSSAPRIVLGKDCRLSSPALSADRPLAPALEHALCEHYEVGLTRGAMAAAWERRTCAFAVGDVEDPGVRDAVQSTQWRGKERRNGGTPRPATAAA